MLKKKSPSLFSEKTIIANKEEHSLEFVDEVTEGVKSFLIMIVVCDVSLLFIFTIVLLLTSPLLAPVGIFFIVHLIAHYHKNIQKLKNTSDD